MIIDKEKYGQLQVLRSELNTLVINVKLNKETNKSLIRKKKKEIARFLTNLNRASGDTNDK